MDIRFREKFLQRCYQNHAEAVRRWGDAVARRYVERINVLSRCKSSAELAMFPSLKFHPLKGKRAGQYAITLVGRTRLTVTFEDKAMEIVCVEEVSEHYGD